MRSTGSFLLLLLSAGFASAQQPWTQASFDAYTLKTFDGKQVEAELGRLPVGESPARSKQIQIAFVRLKSRASQPGPPIVFLMGGAGRGIVMGQIPVFYRLFDQLRDLSDVLLLDQRGIGMAVPDFEAACAPGPAAPPDALISAERLLEVQLAAIGRCAEQLRAKGIEIAAYSVANRAADLEALRHALGADRLILLAWSAGTEVALETIRRYGSHIDAAVLAGTVGPDNILTLPSTADLQLRKISALVATDPAYKDSRDLTETVKELIRRLDTNPMTFDVTDVTNKQQIKVRVGKTALQSAIEAEISDGRALSGLPAWIYALAQGDGQWFQHKVESMYRAAASASMLGLVLGCERGWSEERLQRVRREARGAIIGTDGSPLPQACAMLKLPPGDAHTAAVFSTVRTLFVTGTLDAAAPPFQAEEVRFGFPNSSHLVVKNATHDVLVIPAVQTAIADFLKGGHVGGAGIAAAIPAFAPVRQ
jgi:pimeloyl-ACP methyl ester carboxylesterase